jgi:hypothetical protein
MTENSPGDHSGAFDNQRVERDQLPLPDYDHLPLASLIQRIRSLDAEGLRLLLTYETSHGSRLPIVDALQTRQAELPEGMNPQFRVARCVGAGAVRATAESTHDRPDKIVTDDQPASHGDPTNPAQPR